MNSPCHVLEPQKAWVVAIYVIIPIVIILIIVVVVVWRCRRSDDEGKDSYGLERRSLPDAAEASEPNRSQDYRSQYQRAQSPSSDAVSVSYNQPHNHQRALHESPYMQPSNCRSEPVYQRREPTHYYRGRVGSHWSDDQPIDDGLPLPPPPGSPNYFSELQSKLQNRERW